MNKILLLVAFLSAGILGVLFYSKPRLYFIDIQEALAQPARLLEQSKFSTSLKEQLLKDYAAKLHPTIKNYGEKKGITIVSAILLTRSGGYDLTDVIVEETLSQVKING